MPREHRQKCNYPYYHESHSMIVVTEGLARDIVIWICSGSEPSRIPPADEMIR